jgi:putative transposase
MTGYRRNFVAGGSFFFTVNLADRRLQLLTESIDALRTAFRETQRHHPFTIDAIVVLPDHLHSVWTLPEGDADFSTRWRLIKTSFSRKLSGGEPISSSRAGKGERGIWQRRYWEHTIRDEDDFSRHIDYIHIQPSQTWACDTCQGLAAFVVSPHGETRYLPGGLGGRCFRPRRGVWRKALNARRGDGYRFAPPILRSRNAGAYSAAATIC